MILKTTVKKSVDVNDYKLLQMAYPNLENEITYDEFKAGKVLASIRAYDLAFTDGVVRQVIIPFLEFGAINYGYTANAKC